MLLLLACTGPSVVEWYGTSSDDVAEDVALTIFTLGLATGGEDRAEVAATHAAGTELRMRLVDASGGSDHLSLVSLSPTICSATEEGTDGEGWTYDLLFSTAGSTDLYVTDEDGAILDWQPIEIRDATAATIYAYDALTVGDVAPLDQLDVLPDAAATMALAWASSTGEALSGTGILDVSSDLDGVTTRPTDALESSAYESFDVLLASDAPAGSGTLSISAAGTAVRELPIVVHDPSEVSAVELQADIEESTGDTGYAADGTIRAHVSAGDVTLQGVGVVWKQDGEPYGQGTWVRVHGETANTSHTIEACFGDLCDEVVTGAEIESVEDSVETPRAFQCGCATGGTGAAGAGWAAALGGIGVVLARRRRGR